MIYEYKSEEDNVEILFATNLAAPNPFALEKCKPIRLPLLALYFVAQDFFACETQTNKMAWGFCPLKGGK